MRHRKFINALGQNLGQRPPVTFPYIQLTVFASIVDASSHAITLDIIPTLGNTLYMYGFIQGNGARPTLTLVNTGWTLDTSNIATTNQRSVSYSKTAGASEPTTITFTPSLSCGMVIIVIEWIPGLATHDDETNNSTNSGNNAQIMGNTSNNSGLSENFFAQVGMGLGVGGNTLGPYKFLNGFTQLAYVKMISSQNVDVLIAWKVEISNGSKSTTLVNNTTASFGMYTLISYKAP